MNARFARRGDIRLALMDHRKTWNFTMKASPGECLEAFRQGVADAENSRLRKCRWSVRVSGERGTATFEGPRGLKFGNAELKKSIGSTIEFVAELDGTATSCAMWVGEATMTFGIIPGAPFFKDLMRAVEARLRSLDQSLTVDLD